MMVRLIPAWVKRTSRAHRPGGLLPFLIGILVTFAPSAGPEPAPALVHIGQLGAHGVGEMGTNGVPPAMGNASLNATGIRLRSLSYTPDKPIEARRDG